VASLSLQSDPRRRLSVRVSTAATYLLGFVRLIPASLQSSRLDDRLSSVRLRLTYRVRGRQRAGAAHWQAV